MKNAFEYTASGQLMDDAKCYEVVRELLWPDGVKCPACDSGQTFGKRRFHADQAHSQRYSCQECGRQFDDLSGAVSEGHRQGSKTWITMASIRHMSTGFWPLLGCWLRPHCGISQEQ